MFAFLGHNIYFQEIVNCSGEVICFIITSPLIVFLCYSGLYLLRKRQYSSQANSLEPINTDG